MCKHDTAMIDSFIKPTFYSVLVSTILNLQSCLRYHLYLSCITLKLYQLREDLRLFALNIRFISLSKLITVSNVRAAT